MNSRITGLDSGLSHHLLDCSLLQQCIATTKLFNKTLLVLNYESLKSFKEFFDPGYAGIFLVGVSVSHTSALILECSARFD